MTAQLVAIAPAGNRGFPATSLAWASAAARTTIRVANDAPAVNLRPDGDHPGRALVMADLPRVAAILQRIAADVDELAQARRVQDLNTAAVLPDPRAERHRRLPASSTPQLERAWDAWQAERYRRGEISQRPGYTDNSFRPR